MTLDTKDLAPFLTPTLKLFLSVDLVGSTALKQAGHFPISIPKEGDGLEKTHAQWFSEVANFYREMEREFATFWSNELKISKKVKWDIGEAPKLWKTNGDELIYVMSINKPIDAFFAIVCWMKAFKKYREHLNQAKNKKLDVKASAWVAGFPVANSEIVFRSSISADHESFDSGDLTFEHFNLLNQWYEDKDKPNTDLVMDYIGPSIDTGFRIASLATPRKFTLSLETALILSFVRPPEQFDDIVFMYDGRKELKGVLGGKPYPTFWIDTHQDNELSELEDKLVSPQPQCADDVRKFCLEFIKQYENYMFTPFMLKCEEEPLLSSAPENYKAHLEHMNTKWKAEKEKFDNENAALANEEFKDEDGTEAEEITDISISITFKKTPSTQESE